MSKAHESAAELLDGLLRKEADRGSLTLGEIDQALDRIEDLSKEAQTDEDEMYLESVAETILGLWARLVSSHN